MQLNSQNWEQMDKLYTEEKQTKISNVYLFKQKQQRNMKLSGIEDFLRFLID